MPPQKVAKNRAVRVAAGSSWNLAPTPPATVRRSVRGVGGTDDNFDDLVAKLEKTGRVEVHSDVEAQPPVRRGLLDEPLPLEVPVTPGERYVALVRHPSGALTIEAPAPSATRGIATIHVYPRGEEGPAVRRGLGSILRVVIFKIAGKLAGALLEKLAEKWEQRRWEKHPRGWVKVTAQGLLDARAGKAELKKAVPADFGRRNLLLLHGTLSSTEGAFGKLVETKAPDGRDFFAWARSTYDSVLGFNHPTISVPLEDNATELLAGLPAEAHHFDVITHSRGGLVLRQLVERTKIYPNAGRFVLDRGVLVAVPNEGTALASEKRWQDTVGWIANLLEMFPDNPFTLGVSFVAEGLNWLAQAAFGRLRGLSAMDPGDREIALLQDPPEPPSEAYSALVANFEPGGLAARLFDAGMDGFFAGANDLVVPSEGGWLADRAFSAIPAERIGCYGPGGNLDGPGDVHHLNLFGQPATVDFLIRALSKQSPVTKPLDPKTLLPFTGRTRGVIPGRGIRSTDILQTEAVDTALRPTREVAFQIDEQPLVGDVLQILFLCLNPWDKKVPPVLIASYRNARVMSGFPAKEGMASERYQAIIEEHQRLRRFTEGLTNEAPPQEELEDLGASLFRYLFPGQIRRLYDEVRSKTAGRRLDLVITSNSPWVSELPWEFAFDSDRRNFLALEEINLTRNVMTNIPAEEIAVSSSPLRVLVASSAPLDAPRLSLAKEASLIFGAFKPLQEAGLLEVEELSHATPALLQQRLYEAALVDRKFDVLHFVGHGQFDPEKDDGFLLMEDENQMGFVVGADSLRRILCRRGLRIVFLNACETGSGSLLGINRGLASRLVEGGLPTVIANQYAVLDAAAVIFAHRFYLALAYGSSVGDAVREARVAVDYSLPDGTMDWAVPVVFAQNPREKLCKPVIGSRREIPPPVLPDLPIPAAPSPVAPAAPQAARGKARPRRAPAKKSAQTPAKKPTPKRTRP